MQDKNATYKLDLYVLNMVLVKGGDDRSVLLWNLNKDISDYESKDNSYFCFGMRQSRSKDFFG